MAVPNTPIQDYSALQQAIKAARDLIPAENHHGKGLMLCRRYSQVLNVALREHADRIAHSKPEYNGINRSMLILAVGGFGRNEVNLHSDLDLLFLFEVKPTDVQEAFLKEFLYPLWNVKLQPSYMIKEITEMDAAIGGDLDLATTVMSTQGIWGSEEFLQKFQEVLRRILTLKHQNILIDRILNIIESRHLANGGTFSLLEPNIKEAKGGLRDVHGIYWLSYLYGGAAELSSIVDHGFISDRDMAALNTSLDFLLTLRNSLHLLTGHHEDRLTVEYQITISRSMNYCNSENCLPEELLMREYYEHAEVVSRLLQRLIKIVKHRISDETTTRYSKVRGSRIEGHFWQRDGEIWVDPEEAAKVTRDSAWMLHLFIACALYHLSPTDATLELVSQSCRDVDDEFRHSSINRERFLMILRNTKNSGKIIRFMHESRFLETLVPDFAKLRHLPRIDYYHKYTVDEHLLRAVEKCNQLFQESSPLYDTHCSKVAREILRLDLLHFAILMHDVGKGEGRKHVIRGSHMIQAFAARIKLSGVETKILHDLVANHHQISTVTLMRNADDPRVPEQLAKDLKSPELLKMLYVLTCCDQMAVSEESWNDWKATLLAQMYERTMNHMTPLRDFHPTNDMIYVDLPDLLSDSNNELIPLVDGTADKQSIREEKKHTVKEFILNMPERYRQSTPPEYIRRHLKMVEKLTPQRTVVLELEITEDSNYSILHCATKYVPTFFCNLCGAIMSKNLVVQSAQIYTAKNGVCINVFQIQDRSGKPPISMDVFERLEEKLIDVIREKTEPNWALPKFTKTVAISEERLSMRPPVVSLSNDDTSEVYSILEIRAPDRPGLLYEIASSLEKHRVHVHIALIATESYQVIDVFYVTDWDHQRLHPSPSTDLLCKDLRQLVSNLSTP
ncbi:MAG: hypothetical protein ACFCU1_06315 [Sumerlaeia bacterium]